MKTHHVTMEQKLAGWELAFNSTPNRQKDQSLEGLIAGLRAKIGLVSTGVV